MHPRKSKAPRTRSVLLATGLLVVGIAPFGIAATGDSLREGRRNGTTYVRSSRPAFNGSRCTRYSYPGIVPNGGSANREIGSTRPSRKRSGGG